MNFKMGSRNDRTQPPFELPSYDYLYHSVQINKQTLVSRKGDIQ
jgi:hypothetical protein